MVLRHCHGTYPHSTRPPRRRWPAIRRSAHTGGQRAGRGFGGGKIWAAAAVSSADGRRTVLYEIAPIAATNGGEGEREGEEKRGCSMFILPGWSTDRHSVKSSKEFFTQHVRFSFRDIILHRFPSDSIIIVLPLRCPQRSQGGSW